jgi:ribosomal protein L32
MSVRMKLSHAKTGSRRAHHRTTTKTLTKSEGVSRVRHHVDLETGMYRGKQILKTAKVATSKADTKAKKETDKK